VVTATADHNKRVSLAALIAVEPSQHPPACHGHDSVAGF
jgi:hypothetical protein